MRIVVLAALLALSGCGKFKGDKGDIGPEGLQGKVGEKGDPGKDGEDGEDGAPGSSGRVGESGPIGAPGERGGDGRDGEMGERGPRGYPGNVDELVGGYYRCTGRYQLDGYRWYRLVLYNYDMTTGERYVTGRSDLFSNNGDVRPDSAVAYGTVLDTATFSFEFVEDKWKWTHLNSKSTGFLDCGSDSE